MVGNHIHKIVLGLGLLTWLGKKNWTAKKLPGRQPSSWYIIIFVKATRSFIWVGGMCQKLYTCDHCYESWIQSVRGGQETGNLRVRSHYCIQKEIQRGDHSYWKIMGKCKSCPAANRIKLIDAVHMTSRRDRSHARLVLRNISPCRKSRSAAHHECPLGIRECTAGSHVYLPRVPLYPFLIIVMVDISWQICRPWTRNWVNINVILCKLDPIRLLSEAFFFLSVALICAVYWSWIMKIKR